MTPAISPIISCSRRTDVPAFLMEWVVDKIQKKRVDVSNPFNQKITTVSLDPQDVIAWVWWSKNYQPWIDSYTNNPDIFSQYNVHIFNFTINSVSELETGLVLPLSDRFKQLKWLIDLFGVDHLQVRFDPIVFYTKIGSNTILNNLSDFELIVSKISNLGIKKVIFSFAEAYSKVKKRMFHRGKVMLQLSKEEKRTEIGALLDISKQFDITLHACCQPELVGYKGIQQSHCVDGELINKLAKKKIKLTRDKGQREHCGCQKSRDIGGYTGIFKCGHNCDYCYAIPTRK
ncbi:MAG: DUF1848 family protein [Promethearchaeota archaeon]|nr:MAG: DUF1848 family protein [Candidatus Lokiarchaeota archaeon]